MLKQIPSSLLDIGKLISGNVATKAIGILVLAFYARVLTKEEMAIIPIYTMLCGLASVIFSFGLKANLMKWLPSLLKEDMRNAPLMGNVQEVGEYCRAAMGHLKHEQFRLLFLNQKNMLIADEVQQTGTVDRAPLVPKGDY